MKSAGRVLLLVIIAAGLHNANATALTEDYYATSCPKATTVVEFLVAFAVFSNPILAPQLLRLHFHDCFVRGCDASVLIYKSDHTAEMDGIPNKDSLQGFDFINNVKAVLEVLCPRTVSCADLVALAARDAVYALAVKEGLYKNFPWSVPLGRKDGFISSKAETLLNLPGPTSNYSTLVSAFAAKGLSESQMVVLSGAHTIGTSNCTHFYTRLYNFTGNGGTDPTINSTFATYLKNECPPGIQTKRIAMKDQTDFTPSTNYTFDQYYFTNVVENKGLFSSDATLITNSNGASVVTNYSNDPIHFLSDFNSAMVAMGAIGVITDPQGHVRTNCSDATS